MEVSTLNRNTGVNGIAALGDNIVGLTASPGYTTAWGSSVAVPIVVGTLALLWSLFERTPGYKLRHALVGGERRRSVSPPPLNIAGVWQRLTSDADGVLRRKDIPYK
jgi:subtilisin family serine protease